MTIRTFKSRVFPVQAKFFRLAKTILPAEDELNDAAEAERHRKSPIVWEIEGRIAGGGVPVHPESVSDNVYFRRIES